MTTKEAYERAKQLAQSGEYEAALQALIGYDHPKIEALRVQIREAIALKHGKSSATVAQKSKGVTQDEVAKGMHQYEQERMRNGCVFGLMLLGAIFLCAVVLVVWTGVAYP